MSGFAVNRVVLIGRLTRDPELRATPSGTTVCALRIACNSARRDEEGGWVEVPHYFDVSVFGPQADAVGTHTRRGGRVAVDGHLEWREWEAADGQRRQAVSVVAETVQFLDRPQSAEGDGEGEQAAELAGVGAGGEEAPF